MNLYTLFAKEVDIRLTAGLNGFICTTRYGSLQWKTLEYLVGRHPAVKQIDRRQPQTGISREPPQDS